MAVTPSPRSPVARALHRAARVAPLGRFAGLLIAALAATAARADSLDDWQRMKRQTPRSYVAARAAVAPAIDGTLDDAAWEATPWTDEFVDIEGDARPAPTHRTRAKMLWDDTCFYIAAQLDEPDVWATIRDHDAVIFQDNDFEVFVDPDGDNHHYYEFEMNALNTGWDLFLPKPYKDGGKADDAFELAGLRTAVAVQGTLNDPGDTDRGWSVEIAIPWASLREVTHRNLPPKDGEQWQIGFSRVEWEHEIVDGTYRRVPGKPEYNWVWSPTGVIDMHRPERWGVIQFHAGTADLPAARPLEEWENRTALIDCFEAQRSFHYRTGRYAKTFDELGFSHPGMTLEATSTQFYATLGSFSIDHEWRLSRLK